MATKHKLSPAAEGELAALVQRRGSHRAAAELGFAAETIDRALTGGTREDVRDRLERALVGWLGEASP